MSPFAEASERRQQLGRALRQLRDAAGLTGTQLATLLGVAQSTISRLENGRALPSPEQLDQWAAATGATTQQRLDLDALAEAAATEAIAWRGRPERLAALQRDTAGLEASAGLNRGYHPVLVPALARVPGYAQAVYRARADLDGQADAEVAEAVTAQIARQTLLYRPGHRFEFLLTEAGLRWRFVPREVLAAQVDQLARVARMPNVLLGIIPMEVGMEGAAPAWGWQGFAAFLERADGADDLVLVETLTAALTVRNTADVARYGQAFARLLDLAATGPDALAILDRLAADLW
jgi:transcriptional regulator with XRE-family HTH domain